MGVMGDTMARKARVASVAAATSIALACGTNVRTIYGLNIQETNGYEPTVRIFSMGPRIRQTHALESIGREYNSMEIIKTL